jgi:hypothetical protein
VPGLLDRAEAAATEGPGSAGSGDPMAVIDPSARQVMAMASDLLAARDVIRRQRKQMWALCACLRAEQQAQVALLDLLDELLSDDG